MDPEKASAQSRTRLSKSASKSAKGKSTRTKLDSGNVSFVTSWSEDTTTSYDKEKAPDIKNGTSASASISKWMSYLHRAAADTFTDAILLRRRDPESAERRSRTIEDVLKDDAAKRQRCIDIVVWDFPRDFYKHVMRQLQGNSSTPNGWHNKPASIHTDNGLDIQVFLFPGWNQPNSRRRWMDRLNSVSAVLFVVDISTYDEMLEYSDPPVNILKEQIEWLWGPHLSSKYFQKTPFILFLSNIDMFRKKIHEAPLAQYFGDYWGGDDVKAAERYFVEKFQEVFRDTRKLYIRTIESTWTNEEVQGQLVSSVQELTAESAEERTS